jgi:membrane protein DedA with SNARE-associated domain
VEGVTHFLAAYGGPVLFGVVFAEQVGLPLPAVPLLLAAGALAGGGRMSLWAALGLPVLASLLGDTLWYELGRRRGSRVLNLLCRISLEPDSCVRRTENLFVRHGVRSLLLAKFIPGLSIVAPPLAGIFGVRVPRFLLYDGLGALFWAEIFVGVGYLFSSQLERAAAYAARLGSTLVALLAAAVVAYVLCKYAQRRHVLRRLRIARIEAEELRRMLDAGAEIMIVDLRHPLDVQAAPYTIPGALRMAPEEVERRHPEIPRGRDIVLFCT